MESTEEQSGLLHRILPPRLEDAGLEDCALPPESIHQAFLKAANAVKSSIFSSVDDEDGGDCVSDPWPTADDASDTVVGIDPETEPPGSCAVERGFEAGGDDVLVGGGDDVEEIEVGDKVVVGEGVEKLGEGGESCVDGLQGLGIKEDEKKKKSNDGEEEEKKPTLIEAFVV